VREDWRFIFKKGGLLNIFVFTIWKNSFCPFNLFFFCTKFHYIHILIFWFERDERVTENNNIEERKSSILLISTAKIFKLCQIWRDEFYLCFLLLLSLKNKSGWGNLFFISVDFCFYFYFYFYLSIESHFDIRYRFF
jgi:hypothetical protein